VITLMLLSLSQRAEEKFYLQAEPAQTMRCVLCCIQLSWLCSCFISRVDQNHLPYRYVYGAHGAHGVPHIYTGFIVCSQQIFGFSTVYDFTWYRYVHKYMFIRRIYTCRNPIYRPGHPIYIASDCPCFLQAQPGTQVGT
jgi:hypothetical protein